VQPLHTVVLLLPTAPAVCLLAVTSCVTAGVVGSSRHAVAGYDKAELYNSTCVVAALSNWDSVAEAIYCVSWLCTASRGVQRPAAHAAGALALSCWPTLPWQASMCCKVSCSIDRCFATCFRTALHSCSAASCDAFVWPVCWDATNGALQPCYPPHRVFHSWQGAWLIGTEAEGTLHFMCCST
jgi:hypothetical protein